jgi:peroxin-11C
MMDLDKTSAVLGMFSGRDKAIRTVYYALVVLSEKSRNRVLGEKLGVVAAQMSAARLIARRFGDIPLLKNNIKLANTLPSAKDKVAHKLELLSGLLYQLYYPVEHVAWLSGHKILSCNAPRWQTWTVRIWAMALFVNIARTVREYLKLVLKRTDDPHMEQSKVKEIEREEREQLLNLLMYLSDFMNAINFLPKGFLWSQTLPRWKVGAFGFLASAVGLFKIYKALPQK